MLGFTFIQPKMYMCFFLEGGRINVKQRLHSLKEFPKRPSASWCHARLVCHAALLLWLFVAFLFPSCFFTLLRSMSRKDGNHHNNMHQHSSLVYMHSSHHDSCLDFNGSALVFATM